MAKGEAALSWNDAWAFLSNAPNEVMKDFWEQIGFVEFIQSKSPKYQIEILENAPTWVYKYLYKYLHPVTKSKLDSDFGVQEEKPKQEIKPTKASWMRIVIE